MVIAAGVCFAGFKTRWPGRVRRVLFFVFVVLCTTFLWLSFQSAWLATFGVRTQAYVTESYSNVSGGNATHYATVKLPNGTEVRMTGTPDWSVGQTVDVYADSVTSQPPIAASQIDDDNHIPLWLGAASGLVASGPSIGASGGSSPGRSAGRRSRSSATTSFWTSSRISRTARGKCNPKSVTTG